MIPVKKISSGLLAVVVTILLVSFAIQGFWPWAIAVLLAGLLWWYAEQTLDWNWISSLGLVLFIIAAGFGTWFGIPIFAMLAVVMLALSVWDLESFADRLQDGLPADSTQALVQDHLRRLILMNTVALFLAAFALVVELKISFIIAFLLGLGMAFGLNRFLMNIRKNFRQKED